MRLDSEVYPDERVQAALKEAGTKRLSVDVSRDKRTAAALDVIGIPEAVLLTPEGKVLMRIEGFFSVAEFCEKLAAAAGTVSNPPRSR